MEIGFFSYLGVDYIGEAGFQFWEFDFIDDVKDSYYNKYYSSDAGFGIWILCD